MDLLTLIERGMRVSLAFNLRIRPGIQPPGDVSAAELCSEMADPDYFRDYDNPGRVYAGPFGLIFSYDDLEEYWLVTTRSTSQLRVCETAYEAHNMLRVPWA